MKDYLVKVKAERQQLDSKIDKLKDFLESGDLSEVSQPYLLQDQLEIMQNYSRLLTRRLVDGNGSGSHSLIAGSSSSLNQKRL